MWQSFITMPMMVLLCTVLLGCAEEPKRKAMDTDLVATGGSTSLGMPGHYPQDEPTDLSTEPRIALVIANGAYQHVPHLPNSNNDAKLITKTLTSLGFKLIGDGPILDADKNTMERAIRDFGQAITGKSVGLFYYSGHGIQWHGQNYLVPVTADVVSERDVKYELVDANFIIDEMGTAGNRLNLVILDACRNNPFGSRRFKGVGVGLAAMEAAAGTVLAFATQPGSKALAGTGRYSPYTEALAATINQPGLGLFETLNAVGVAVEQATGGQQQPWFNASPIKGAFYFAGPPDTVEYGATGDYSMSMSEDIKSQPPLNNQFSLSDLTSQDGTTRSQWNQWQAQMQAAFDATAAFQANPTLQRTAWTRFLTTYPEDNPYSNNDELLRKEGAQRKAAIQDQPVVATPPIVATPPVSKVVTTPSSTYTAPKVQRPEAALTTAPVGKIAISTVPTVAVAPITTTTVVPPIVKIAPVTVVTVPPSITGAAISAGTVPLTATTTRPATPVITVASPIKQNTDPKNSVVEKKPDGKKQPPESESADTATTAVTAPPVQPDNKILPPTH